MSERNREVFENHATSSIEELTSNPNKFGAPTFEQYKADRDKYLGRNDDTFNAIDKGSRSLGKVAVKHEYEIEGFRCKSLEEVERVASEQLGINIDQLDYRPELIPQGGGKCNVLVKFISKDDREKRDQWR